MVSVSRFAAPPHFGQTVFTNSGVLASGDSPIPVNFGFAGSNTGKSLSGTGTMPSFSQLRPPPVIHPRVPNLPAPHSHDLQTPRSSLLQPTSGFPPVALPHVLAVHTSCKIQSLSGRERAPPLSLPCRIPSARNSLPRSATFL